MKLFKHGHFEIWWDKDDWALYLHRNEFYNFNLALGHLFIVWYKE